MGIGASIVLLAVGAILAFAVTIDPSAIGSMTVDWDTIGVILMVLGAVGLIWSLVALNAWRDRTVRHVDDRPIERDRIVER